MLFGFPEFPRQIKGVINARVIEEDFQQSVFPSNFCRGISATEMKLYERLNDTWKFLLPDDESIICIRSVANIFDCTY